MASGESEADDSGVVATTLRLTWATDCNVSDGHPSALLKAQKRLERKRRKTMSNLKNVTSKKNAAKSNCDCGICYCGCPANACNCQAANCQCGCGKPASGQ